MLLSSQQIHGWRKFVRTVSVNMKIPVAVANLTFRKTLLEKGFLHRYTFIALTLCTVMLNKNPFFFCTPGILNRTIYFFMLQVGISLRAGTLAASFQSVNLQISHSQKPSDFKDQEQG